MDLDLRKLRSFVLVAERLSFVQAADELHVTQPALSRQIQALEHDLGVSLLIRDRRGTALTGAGRQLLEDGKVLLDTSLGVERRARAAARTSREFTIGFMPGVPSTEIVREFTSLHPHITIDVRAVPMDEQESYLHDGRVDISFVRLPMRSNQVRSVPLFDEPKVAVVPQSSALADAESAVLDDLLPLPLLDDPATLPAWKGDTLPRRRPLVGIDERLEAVAAGTGFIVVPAGIAASRRRDDVAAIRLDDVQPIVVALGYLKHREMAEIEQFARIAREHLAPASARSSPSD